MLRRLQPAEGEAGPGGEAEAGEEGTVRAGALVVMWRGLPTSLPPAALQLHQSALQKPTRELLVANVGHQILARQQMMLLKQKLMMSSIMGRRAGTRMWHLWMTTSRATQSQCRGGHPCAAAANPRLHAQNQQHNMPLGAETERSEKAQARGCHLRTDHLKPGTLL
jgi:hypothetical protein